MRNSNYVAKKSTKFRIRVVRRLSEPIDLTSYDSYVNMKYLHHRNRQHDLVERNTSRDLFCNETIDK